jgi:DNA polymerase-3 subunit beta
MKVQVEKDLLVKALSSVQSVVEKKGPPILSHVLIEASNGEVKFFATDFDLAIRVHTDATVVEEGKATAPARSFFEIAKEFPAQMIELKVDNAGRVDILAEKASFQLPSLEPSDFPVDQFEEEVEYHSCNAQLLEKALSKTFYAIPSSGSSISIAGLYVSCDSHGVYKFISCDAFRLARFQISRDEIGLNFDPGEIIIPRKGVQEILRLINDASGSEILLGVHENVLYAKNDRMTVSMRLLDASFPAFDSIIPQERPNKAEISVDLFQQVLKRMAIFTNQVWRHVNIVISPGVLEVSAGNAEIGMAREELPINYSGQEIFKAAFNIKYLGDAVSAISGDTFHFEWSPEMEGGFITDPEEPGYTAFFMPMVAE